MNGNADQKRSSLFMRIALPLLVLAAFVWFLQLGKAPKEIMARRDCERRYAEARTAAETLAVDGQFPVIQSRPRNAEPETCGRLLRAP